MTFKRLTTTFIAVCSIYVLLSNYYIQDFIYLTKQRSGINIHARIYFEKKPFDGFNDTAKVSAAYIDEHQHQTEAQFNKSQIHSFALSAGKIDPLNRVIPFYETYDVMLEDDSKGSVSRSYPNVSLCPFLGLRKPYITLSDVTRRSTLNKTCRQKPRNLDDCQEAVRYFGKPGSIEELPCSSKPAVICSLLRKRSRNRWRVVHLSCNQSACDGQGVLLGLFDDSSGMITDWQIVPDTKLLGDLLHRHISNSTFGSGFALLRCRTKEVYQVLVLPKNSRSSGSKTKRGKSYRVKRNRVNVNIVIEDSLSRPHFFRTLSKTTSALREIIYNQSIKASVLDFEMVQSYASTTYNNIQRLFAGRKYFESDSKVTYGVEDLFATFNDRGYATLFQEDSCWYDKWGTLLEPRQRISRVANDSVITQRWKTFLETIRQSGVRDVINDYGMTFLTCTAYAHLHTTNIYDPQRFPNVCFKGRHYSSLLLEYAKKYASANDVGNGRPFISYTHVLTSHESNGRRVVNDDATLADFLLNAAQLRNTVTILASDHGAKSTRFSSYTVQGRQEVFQPLLFIIVPSNVAVMLGREVMHSLVVNQKRLVGLEDLHYALVSLQSLKGGSGGAQGLFQTLPSNRTCEDLKVTSDVLCLCEGMDIFIANTSYNVLWAAEYALGTINNRIQDQYIAGLNAKHAGNTTRDYHGYGACQRYVGLGTTRARLRVMGENEILHFSLIVQPFHLQTTEIFDVEVAFPVKKVNGITLENLVRVSMFNVYEQCADDDSVDAKLCSCRFNDSDIVRWQKEFILKVPSRNSFSLQPETRVLDDPCLIIISRAQKLHIKPKSWQDNMLTYEAFNACANVTYNLTVGIRKAVKTRLSNDGPFIVELFPRSVTFLMTVQNEWKYGKVIPQFNFERTVLNKQQL